MSAPFDLDRNKIIPKVIYGVDNRREVYEVSQKWQELAASTVTIIRSDRIDSVVGNDNLYKVSGPTYGVKENLCHSEPYREQKSVAHCSAFLVAPDIVATAGHCIRDKAHCRTLAFVFDYQKNKKGNYNYEIPKKNFYACDDIIEKEENSGLQLDYALIRLTKKVKDRKPLALRKSGRPSLGDEMVVIGHPYGIPKKVADQGFVIKNNHPSFFKADLDTFSFNSGSAVINATTFKVEGILVRGEEDFVFDGSQMCNRSKVCAPGECNGEDVTRITQLNIE